jgi:hypothetical protein
MKIKEGYDLLVDKTVTITTLYTTIYGTDSNREIYGGATVAGGKLGLATWATDADKAYANAHPEIYDVPPGGFKASGGLIGPGDWGIVGDLPGRRTGAEELVQALPGGGAMVYSNSQSQGILGNNISTRNLELASDRQTAMLRSMQNSLENLPMMIAAAIQKMGRR